MSQKKNKKVFFGGVCWAVGTSAKNVSKFKEKMVAQDCVFVKFFWFIIYE